MNAIKLAFTVWEFRSPSTGEVCVCARMSEPIEIEHEYQRVLGRCSAYTAQSAIQEISGKGEVR